MDALDQFFSLGVEYYVTARWAIQNGQTRIAPSLFHHAVEMCLKGGLSKTMTLVEMKQRLSHKLPKTWAAFKAAFPAAADLGRFDDVVEALDKFEDLRYPDSVLANGLQMHLAMTNAPGIQPSWTEPPRIYKLVVQDVDQLLAAIFQVASVNPAFFISRFLSDDVRESLSRVNEAFRPWLVRPDHTPAAV